MTLAALLEVNNTPIMAVMGVNLEMAICGDCRQCSGTGIGYDGWFCSDCQAAHYDALKAAERAEDIKNEYYG